jgi:hypothetical protein
MVLAWVAHFVTSIPTMSDDDQTRPQHTTQTHIKHHHHGGGPANPAWRRGFNEPTLLEGWTALRMLLPRPPSKRFNRFNKLK